MLLHRATPVVADIALHMNFVAQGDAGVWPWYGDFANDIAWPYNISASEKNEQSCSVDGGDVCDDVFSQAPLTPSKSLEIYWLKKRQELSSFRKFYLTDF